MFCFTARPLSFRASGSLQNLDQHQKDDGADRGMDDGSDDAAAYGETDPREQPAGDEGADDADDDVADHAEAETGTMRPASQPAMAPMMMKTRRLSTPMAISSEQEGERGAEGSESAPISTASGYSKAAGPASGAH